MIILKNKYKEPFLNIHNVLTKKEEAYIFKLFANFDWQPEYLFIIIWGSDG